MKLVPLGIVATSAAAGGTKAYFGLPLNFLIVCAAIIAVFFVCMMFGIGVNHEQ